MNCRKVSHLMSAYMDGELSGIEHRLIHQHLARCPECQEDYESLLQLKHLLAGMSIKEPSKSLPVLILQEIEDDEVRSMERSPAAWVRKFQQSIRRPIRYTHLIGFGVSLAFVGLLFSTRAAISSTGTSHSGIILYPADRSQDAPPPPADELIRGLDLTGSTHFVGRSDRHESAPYYRNEIQTTGFPEMNRTSFVRPESYPTYKTVGWPALH